MKETSTEYHALINLATSLHLAIDYGDDNLRAAMSNLEEILNEYLKTNITKEENKSKEYPHQAVMLDTLYTIKNMIKHKGRKQ